MTIAPQTSAKWVGQSIRRKEDPRLITGRATYVDDLELPGMLHVAVVRSPEAHAKILSIDGSAALERPGIRAVFTGEDMGDLLAPLPMAWAPPGVEIKTPERWPLARGRVCHVGDAVAMVVGDDKYAVVDAAQRVEVEYEPLPVVVNVEEALKDETLVHEQFGTNTAHEWSMGGGDVDAAFADSDVVVERRIVNHRTAGAAIEPRGCIAEYRGGTLTVWSSTQVPHLLRLFYAVQMGISEDKVRVIAPEVGGGFGGKLQVCAEETLCAWASKQLGRPVKWIETRSESMAVSHHGRDQVDYVRMGAKSDGTITAFHAKIIQDLGAYFGLLTPMIPELGAFVMTGCYRIPAVKTDITGVFTNKFFTDAIRGAGRPEMTHMIEVMIDQLADELGMDPIELRRKNFIAPEDFPYDDALRHHVRLGQLRGRARPGPGDHRHGGLPRRAVRPAKPGDPARDRLLDVHRDLRPRAVAGGRAQRLRPRDRPLRVRARPRAPDGLGDGLHRRVAARPGPRDGLRADRRRPPRRRSGRRGDHPRRHRDGPDGPRDVRLALAGDRRRRGRPRRREDRREVPRDRRPQPRGRSRRHRGRTTAGSRCAATPSRG